ncbi:hypothetical protein BDY21DRAFT_379029 [Lineolata rhizophorae]|uniref:Pre-mRNA-splicing factor n=1 Tax=Lineolata rhizophorae TaxID=578093 RepID=A0A6A6P2C2_9PEZI|nr:hypothetical protein BDY21DRAFT_379029 [Lineolata rhizophorae]
MEDHSPATPSSQRNSNGSIVPVTTGQADFGSLSQTTMRPSVAELHGDNHFAETARKYWLNKSKVPKVRQNVLKDELWTVLEREDFAIGSLLILENLQLLEKYLWPTYNGEDASNHHVLLLALMVIVKRREGLPSWEHFAARPQEFSSFFRRVLAMSIDVTLSLPIRSHLISFIIGAFQSLENGLVRKECASLVSISIWHNLHSGHAREEKFEQYPMLKKVWRNATKRFDSVDENVKARMHFERSWLFSLLLDFLEKIYDRSGTAQEARVLYCERFVEFLSDLQSQLPTRRYVNTLLQDLNLLTAIKLSPLWDDWDNGLFRDLAYLLTHFTEFAVDDQTGHQLSQMEYHQKHCSKLARLQRIAYKHYKSKLTILALSNYASLDQRTELEGHLEVLTINELENLCSLLGFRTSYPGSSSLALDRRFYVELVVAAHSRRPSFQDRVRKLPILPTEEILYMPQVLRTDNYNGTHPLAIPKLNLQYLTMGDFLYRSFVLHRLEAFYEIRKHVEEAIKRMQPKRDTQLQGSITNFTGNYRMALPIAKPAILDVAPAKVGEMMPAHVKAEVILDVSRMNYHVRSEWETLRLDDVVFLCAVHPPEKENKKRSGRKDGDRKMDEADEAAMAYLDEVVRNGSKGPDKSEAEKLGLKYLRCAEVAQILDEKGKPLREFTDQQQQQREFYRPRQRRLILRLDAAAFKTDKEVVAKGKPDVYESINLIVRRRPRENNFRPVLESIKKLTLSDIPAPSWLQEVFLGYGDPTSATYKRLPNRLKTVDFQDTFLDWQHLIASLPGKTIEPSEDMSGSFGPPYVLEFPEADATQEELPARPHKKRRLRGEGSNHPPAAAAVVNESVRVSTYKPPNMGPYPTDAPKLNTVRFTPAQIEAITSGTQPGLTVIVGPPGTGKTDVATQIINNIYHNFPQQRTLLIAHSNQALNQLFQKIVALDIDERHLLRLGHGEEELETQANYSKHGRVESFLEIGHKYLSEVDRLARSLGAPGVHGSSCETADYFNQVYILPAWSRYWEDMRAHNLSTEQIAAQFPFHDFFADAPQQPLFPADAPREVVVDIARGCYRHIEKMFTELEDIRPFEILRNARDRANYLLVKEARIIAMTSTHAAMRRQEIAELGFRYDNVVMEEAAQITEMENFVPLALQKPVPTGDEQSGNGKKFDLPLQRVVLCGDHLQNSPIVQNLAFRQFANLEQSLFLRLVRLGVPTINLDMQGRARPSLAELYRWRYAHLGNLPITEMAPKFRSANPGLRFEYQFIDVPDYKGKGEMEPSPHWTQNLGEAEYVVAMYMYMRLLGYPASKISILTTYAGQRALIRDVLTHRCKGNRLFGLPRQVATVDKFQGEQNDYILLSLVRTQRVGYLRDMRRLTVALSRARLGLYVFGRRAVFESSFELAPAFERLFARPTALSLVTGEMYDTAAAESGQACCPRMMDGEGDELENKTTTMQSVEHLGQYVVEMTKAKVEALKAGGGQLPPVQEEKEVEDDEVDPVAMEEEMDVDDGGVQGEVMGEQEEMDEMGDPDVDPIVDQ